MSLEVTGVLHHISETQQVSEKFKKREFVLALTEDVNGNTYTNYAKMQAVQNKCEILDRFKEGDRVTVNFNIKGNKWERDGKVNYITNLDAWRIGPAAGSANNSHAVEATNNYYAGAASPAAPMPAAGPETVDDLPF